MNVQSSKFPFQDLPKIRSSIWTPFRDVYEEHKEILQGISHLFPNYAFCFESQLKVSNVCFQTTYDQDIHLRSLGPRDGGFAVDGERNE